MDNQEIVLLELEEFNRSSLSSSDIIHDKQIPQNLENLIEHVAKTGNYIFPWMKLKKLYMSKLEQVIENFNQISCMDNYPRIPNNEKFTFKETKMRIIDRMNSFNLNAPFTIQRISELLLKPQSNYNRTDKFLRGLEKCIMVVTSVDPNGNKIFTESNLNGSLNDSSTSSYPTSSLLLLPPPSSLLTASQFNPTTTTTTLITDSTINANESAMSISSTEEEEEQQPAPAPPPPQQKQQQPDSLKTPEIEETSTLIESRTIQIETTTTTTTISETNETASVVLVNGIADENTEQIKPEEEEEEVKSKVEASAAVEDEKQITE